VEGGDIRMIKGFLNKMDLDGKDYNVWEVFKYQEDGGDCVPVVIFEAKEIEELEKLIRGQLVFMNSQGKTSETLEKALKIIEGKGEEG
jgi:hypothetical protein